MSFGRVLGLFVGFGAILAAIIIEKGEFGSYINIGALVIILGGCSGAVLISNGGTSFLRIPLFLGRAFSSPKTLPPEETAALLRSIASTIRKEGILAASHIVERIEYPFLKLGLQLVIDGANAEKLEQSLQSYLLRVKQEHKEGERLFTNLGGYSPTMGIIGTVLGLVNMLINLGQLGSEGLGHAVAIAFIATLYGIAFANLFFLPVAGALKERLDAELSYNHALAECIMMIQAGESPRMVERHFYESTTTHF